MNRTPITKLKSSRFTPISESPTVRQHSSSMNSGWSEISNSFRNRRGGVSPFYGFTIVELLIVIVIIAILATITIVAYNGITNRAHESSLKSDLNNGSNLLGIAKTINGTYPADLNTVNNGQAFKSSGDNQPVYNTNAAGDAYCLETHYPTTNPTAAFFVTNTDTNPQQGICDGVTGVPGEVAGGGGGSIPTGPDITNLVYSDSSVESSGSDSYGPFSFNLGPSVSVSRVSGGAVNGNSYRRLTFTSAGTLQTRLDSGFGVAMIGNLGDKYTLSLYAKSSRNDISIELRAYWRGPTCVGVGSSTESSTLPLSGGWQRTSLTLTVPAANTTCGPSVSGDMELRSSGSFAIGDTLDIDAIMITKGASLYKYADGDSLGWHWDSAQYNSSSTGPSSLP